MSPHGPDIVPSRASVQGGVEPTGRSRSPGGHRAVRATRHVRVAQRVETYQNVSSEDVAHLEGRAIALRERVQPEEDSMNRYREEMAAAANLIATQRRELQSRIREQEMFEITLSEQAHSSRELLSAIQEEVRRNEQLRVEAGQQLELTRGRVAREVQQLINEAARQINDRGRRLDAVAEYVQRLRDELQESRDEVASLRTVAERYYNEFPAEQRRMQMGRAIYDTALGNREHELVLARQAR